MINTKPLRLCALALAAAFERKIETRDRAAQLKKEFGLDVSKLPNFENALQQIIAGMPHEAANSLRLAASTELADKPTSLLVGIVAAALAQRGVSAAPLLLKELIDQLAAASGNDLLITKALLELPKLPAQLYYRDFVPAAQSLRQFAARLPDPTDVTTSPAISPIGDDAATVELDEVPDFPLSTSDSGDDPNASKDALPVYTDDDIASLPIDIGWTGTDDLTQTIGALMPDGPEDPAVDYSAQERYAQYLHDGGDLFQDMPIDPLPFDIREPRLVDPAEYPVMDSSGGGGENPLPAVDSPISAQDAKSQADPVDLPEAGDAEGAK